ncbi:hypothetical protein ACJJIK_15765 [Microbulbifer sp. ZKSA006]|uniref:hypothetical protein n=1 Tax=Microbulbifer sp. ZKSA006 TaxID=3243390 RepID=UPI0040397C1F
MATYQSIALNEIGLIVRGKENDAHSPGVLDQHADCILPNGQPIGFFGEGGDVSSGPSGSSGSLFKSSIPSWANGPSASFNKSGLNMKGLVADYDDMLKIRPYYVNINSAKLYNIKSTAILIEVSEPQATLFKSFWYNLKISPGAFNMLGGNCSSKAAKAFNYAKVLNKDIPGLDTPDNLYKHLKAKFKDKCTILSGFIGAHPISGDKYDLVFE